MSLPACLESSHLACSVSVDEKRGEVTRPQPNLGLWLETKQHPGEHHSGRSALLGLGTLLPLRTTCQARHWGSCVYSLWSTQNHAPPHPVHK